MDALIIAIEERDQYTYTHCTRVEALSMTLGKSCALSEREIKLLQISARFHDVGKVGIPDYVLLKAGALNDNEWNIMKTHSEKGERIMLAINHINHDEIGLTVRHHHERYDGTGYPDRLSGEDIPYLARILTIADGYDAMAKRRVYSLAKKHRDIVEIIKNERSKQYDPWIVDKFMEIIESPDIRMFRAQDS